MTVSLLGAVAAAVCYGVAVLLQAVPATRAGAGSAREVGRLVVQPMYVAGVALDGIGFLASLVALRTLPLFFVQAAVASSVGVTALGAVLVLRARLHRPEIGALVVLGIGLVLLAVAARPEAATPLSLAARSSLLAGVAVLAASGVRLVRASGPSGPWLAMVAGLSFAGVGICARGLAVPHPWWLLAADPGLWALAGFGVLGTGMFAAALARTAATTVAAITFAVETVVPAAVGLAVLGDSSRPGLGWAAALGFPVTVSAAIALGRYAEPLPSDRADGSGDDPGDGQG